MHYVGTTKSDYTALFVAHDSDVGNEKIIMYVGINTLSKTLDKTSKDKQIIAPSHSKSGEMTADDEALYTSQ